MNAIIDLSARAVSFITAAQTVFLKGVVTSYPNEKVSILNIPHPDFKNKFKVFVDAEKDIDSGRYRRTEDDNFCIRAVELIWVSKQEADYALAVDYATLIINKVVDWLWTEAHEILDELNESKELYPPPHKWREAICKNLYMKNGQCVKLAEALQYLPVQIILALGGGHLSSRCQRVMQIWNTNDEYLRLLLDKDEIKTHNKFEKLEQEAGISPAALLSDSLKLCEHLLNHESPLPFEHIFEAELKEIYNNRNWRSNERKLAGLQDGDLEKLQYKELPQNDPHKQAKDMKLYALAFSGGGIRSATFNLGILQGLAQKSLLDKFDYLSTVSGGGYIGSWLVAWIKREGSVLKVTNRLNPEKSPEPLGEELKPIKWLRMFSNYFAPNASIMSVDAWTVAITWLRNTLLNQVIIFLLFLSILFSGNLLYAFWHENLKQEISVSLNQVLLISASILVPISVLAGVGMHAYHSERFKLIRAKRQDTTRISIAIIVTALLAAYFLSAWFSSKWYNTDYTECITTMCKLTKLLPATLIAFISLLLVAFLGKYINGIRDHVNGIGYALFILVITALVASFIGLLCLVLAWNILESIDSIRTGILAAHKHHLQFIFGPPLIIEAISITVVARMAFMGKYFPDERREWWGRMGAHVHRISFLWILITASALLGQDFAVFLLGDWWGKVLSGGWIALVGFAVKAAFSAKTSGKETGGGSAQTYLHLLGLAGPYIFVLGLLVFLPGLIEPIFNLVNDIFSGLHRKMPDRQWASIYVILITTLTAWLLGRQVGVNEFSMHHFYRNRLVRAYLGATRRTTDRQRTYNPFTGFDMLDDEKLYRMQNEHGYYGPYPVLNTALNASHAVDLDRQDRKAESFIFSPLFCGFDFSMIKASTDAKNKSYEYAYRQTKYYAQKNGGPTIGTAMAISGAAINPNQGYHSSAGTAFLLTVFNVQMGRWIGNPRQPSWRSSDPYFGIGYIINNLLGRTDTRKNFVALSDGGHFDNMGLYEMIRRKCTYIILCDSEQDDQFTCEGLANAIRRCRIDFGAEIDIDITDIVKRENNLSKVHYRIGTITYAGDKDPEGKLLYIKSSITGDEPIDVHEYGVKNKTFPHQTTADQFFNEEQFESYRKLGLHIATQALKDYTVAKEFNLL